MSCLFLCGPLRRISVNPRLASCYGDRCNSLMRSRHNRLSVLKKVALLIGLACCVSRPGACGGLWTGQMLLVCSTYVFVKCVYCVLFDLRRKLKVAETSVSHNFTLQLNNDCQKISRPMTICNFKVLNYKTMDNTLPWRLLLSLLRIHACSIFFEKPFIYIYIYVHAVYR